MSSSCHAASTATARTQPVVRVPRFLLAACISMAAAVAAPAAFAQHDVPVSLNELVDGSGSIVVGTLLSARPHWNDRHNLIVTDYRFRIERTLIDGGIGHFEFVVTQAGGTLDGETHKLSSNPELFVGARYLAFIDPAAGHVFCPFMGGDQGIYRIDDDDIASALSGRDNEPLDALLAKIDARAQQRGNAPPVFHHAGPAAGVHYPSKQALMLRAPFTAPAQVQGSVVPLQQDSTGEVPEPRPPLAAPSDDPQPQSIGMDSAPTPNWHRFALANRPIVWDEWPHDWWCSPYDQYKMAQWNAIADNLNRVSGTDLGTWAWGNSRFEMVGFPSDADMLAQFGEAWGSSTLAITYSRWNGSGVLLESDIALNPAYCWTLDESRSANSTDSCWGIEQSTLHELGHAWGLAHPWESENVWWDSVMNYAPKEFRPPFLHADDTSAARTSYPGTTMNTDGLLSLYRTSDDSGSLNASYANAFPSSRTIYHGGTLTFGDIQMENTGTIAITNPQIEIYLAQNWRSWTDTYIHLRDASFSLTVNPIATNALTLNATTIPDTTPTGLYYPTLYLRLDGDQSTGNNTAPSSPNIKVTIRNNPATLAPIENWRTWSLGRIGPNGTWELLLPVAVGYDYELSLCSADGGSASFDTVLEVVGVATNDDYCGLSSHLAFTSTVNGTRTVSVRGYDIAAQGTFSLAYRRTPNDIIFRNGFDG